MNIDRYLQNINQRYKLGNASEHTFRGDLQQLLESLVPEIRATNELKREITNAQITHKAIIILPQNFATFENQIKDFCPRIRETIKIAKKLLPKLLKPVEIVLCKISL